MSVSQYKDFLQCESRALARLEGRYVQQESPALLAGKYVHAWNEGVLEEFKKENPKLYKKDGTLYAQYKDLDHVIETIKNDKLMMLALEGQKEIIMTTELFGVPWKIMIDNYNPEKKRFTDLKVVKSLRDRFWKDGRYVSFIENYGYTTQLAVYSEVERIVSERDSYLEGMIVAATKETPPDKAVIGGFDKEMIEDELLLVEVTLPRVLEVKEGKVEPTECGECDYCRANKKLKKVIDYRDLLI